MYQTSDDSYKCFLLDAMSHNDVPIATLLLFSESVFTFPYR